MKKTKVFVRAIERLAHDKYSLEDFDGEWHLKRRGCCTAISDIDFLSFDSKTYIDYFNSIFRGDADNVYGFYFDGKDRGDESGISEAYTSRVIALQLAQILWDEGQVFNESKE